jgi:hypothetical protein
MNECQVRVHKILQMGLDEALKQYVTRNFHILMTDGGSQAALERCMKGVEQATDAYVLASAALDDFAADWR